MPAAAAGATGSVPPTHRRRGWTPALAPSRASSAPPPPSSGLPSTPSAASSASSSTSDFPASPSSSSSPTPLPPPPPLPSSPSPSRRRSSRRIGRRAGVVVGRDGIQVRRWPRPNPAVVIKAHRLMEVVQREQRVQYGVKSRRPLIVVTPTHVRTFQTHHLTGLAHTLMLLPYDLSWVVVEAGGLTNETAAIINKSGLNVVHLSSMGRCRFLGRFAWKPICESML